MKFYCEWEEEQTLRVRCCGTVEAESEEEVAEKLRDGEVEVDEENPWDCLDRIVTNITNVSPEE